MYAMVRTQHTQLTQGQGRMQIRLASSCQQCCSMMFVISMTIHTKLSAYICVDDSSEWHSQEL
jgi:hypothetical protein